MNIWKVIQNGNNMKRIGRDHDGRVIILPPTTAEEHIDVQRESKARTTLLQSIPDDHVADFHYIDDARDIWNAVKARFGGNVESKKRRKSMLKQEFLEFIIGEAEGLHKGYDRMQKILSQLNQLKAKPDAEDINLNATSTSKNMSYEDSPNYSSTTTYSVPSNSKTGSHRSGNVIEDVLQSFVADTKPEQQLAYKDLEQIKKLDLEEMDLKWKMAMLSRYSSFKIKEIGKKEEDSKALITVDTLVDWTNHDNAIKEGAAKLYNLITGANSEEANTAGDAGEFALMGVTSEVHNCPFGCDSKYNELHKQYNELNEQNGEYFIQVQAYKNSLKTLEKQKRVLQRNQVTLEDKIKVLSIELENTSNMLKHFERINADVEIAKKDLQTKLDNHLVQTEKWRNSSKNLFRLIDSSMSIRTKVGLGFTNCISKNELGWDDSAFSVFTTNSEDVEGRPIFHRFAKTDSMKAVPPPLSGDYTSLSDHIDLNESQMSYVTSLQRSTQITLPPVILVLNLQSTSQMILPHVHQLPVTSKVNIPPVRPQPVPTGKTKASAPVPTGKPTVSTPVPVGRPNRPFLVPTDRGYFPSVSSNWWKSTARPMPHYCRPTSSYFRTYTPYAPIMYYNHMKYGGDIWAIAVKPSASCSWNSHRKATKDEGIFDSGCSRSMTGNKERLDDFQAFQGGKMTFGGGEGRITRKGTIRTPTLDFKNVYYMKEMQQFNLFSVSQICDKKNQVLFIDTECLVLSKDFKLPDDSMVHRRMGHVNYKNMNRLVKGNLVRGLPPKLFKNDHTCVACYKEHKDETYPILKDFITLIENQLNKKAKAIRCDNGTEFKNAHMIDLCESKGIKREYSNPRTLQQNRVAERKNRTLIEAARTMLADSKLPTMFWTEAIRTSCYVLNKVSITCPHNKTPYALLTGHIPFISHFKPFGCHVTILNTSDHLGKFDGKADEGYIVGYSVSNKAYRVYNVPNKRVKESMNLRFLKEKPIVQGLGHEWYFDLDYLTNSLGYKHVQANQSAGTQGATTTSAGTPDTDLDFDYDEQVIIVPSYPLLYIQRSEPKDTSVATGYIPVPTGTVPVPPGSLPSPVGSIPIPADATIVSTDDVPVHTSHSTDLIFDDEPITRFFYPSDLGNHAPSPGIFSSSSYDDEFGAALNNVASTVEVSLVETMRINTIHPQTLIIGILLQLYFQHCLFACFLSQVEPRSVAQALEDPSWVDAMQEEMQQFMFQNVWILIDLPAGKYAIGTKWILKNKIEAIRLFLAFAYYMGFLVYQMDVKSAFLYERIDEEVYVTQPKSFVRGTIDKTLFLKKNNRDIILVQVCVYDIIFGSTKKAWCDEFEALMKEEFQMSAMGELTFFLGLQVQQRPDGIFIHQDKSMIGLLMYLTASRPDIMFAVSACSRHQVTPTTSNLETVKKIFKYLKGQPKLGLWYPKESPLLLEAYSDSDYAGANKDRKSTTGGCQFLGRRLISCRCKKQTIMATFSTEAEYVAAANCCGQHIEIRHHFIRDANEKKLIQVLKIHTDDNVDDLLTKAFDGPSLMVQGGGLVLLSVPTGSFVPTSCSLPTGYIDFPSG
nr:hypothetical protein [Tanacetum cinerariifolium]